MREIKFRFWNNVADKPEKSRYFYDVDVVMECLKQQINFDNGKSLVLEHSCYNHIGDGCFFEQYTDLKDKNGKEVYEGDILKWKCSKSGAKTEKLFIVVIEWETNGHGYGLTIYDNGEKWAISKSYWNSEFREIIGNIHENPELLTTK